MIMSGIVAVSVMIILASSAYASDYKTMIRYDRIWESVSMTFHGYTIKYMKFDGTEEINGKTWHRIVTFRKAYPTKYDRETKTYIFEFEDNIYENEGYMREDDGVVYTLLDAYYDDRGDGVYCWFGSQYLSSSDTPNYGIIEAVIYDFNCEEGECYDGFSFFEKAVDYATFKNLSTTTVEIDGEECRRIEIGWVIDYDDKPGWQSPVIEGVGAIEDGCLNYHEFTLHATHMWCYNRFLRVLDMQGNVIFSNDIGYNVPYKDVFVGVETISEGSRMLIGDGTVSFGEDNCLNRVSLYNMQGQQAAVAEGTGRVCLTTAGLTPGVYIAVASTGGKTLERQKIIVR